MPSAQCPVLSAQCPVAAAAGRLPAGLAVRYHDASFASTHRHCRFSACKGRRSVIQAAVMRSEILKTAAGSRPRPAPWPRGTAPPTRVCFLVRVSLVFRRTQCFLNGVLLVATEGGLFYLNASVSQFGLLPKTRCNCRNHRFRFCFRRKVAQLHIQVFYEENWRPRVELHPHINYLR